MKSIAFILVVYVYAAMAAAAPTTQPTPPPGFTAEQWTYYLMGWTQAGGQVAAPPDYTITSGHALHINNSGVLSVFDFGDPNGTYSTSPACYNSAHVYFTPGTYTVTTSPIGGASVKHTVLVNHDSRPEVLIRVGDDLTKVITKPSTIYTFPDGSQFVLSAALPIPANVTLRAAPNCHVMPRLVRQPMPASGSTTLLSWSGADGTLEWMELDSVNAPPAPNKTGADAITPSGGNLVVRNCNFKSVDNCLNCVLTMSKLLVQDCTCGPDVRCYGLYTNCTKNIAWLNTSIADSKRESGIRLESSVPGKDSTQFVLIYGSDIKVNDGKGSIRACLCQYVAACSNTLRSIAGIGDPPGEIVPVILVASHIHFQGNHYVGVDNGRQWMDLGPGVDDVTITDSWDCNPNYPCIALSGPLSTNVRFVNNRMLLAKGVTTYKPLFKIYNTPPAPSDYSETGTVVVPYSASTTQP